MRTAPDDPGTASLRRYLHDVAARMPRTSTSVCSGLPSIASSRWPVTAPSSTGTVFSGQVRAGDTVVVMPADTPVRVRSIHAQNRPTDSGRAGQRCALNLAGVEKSAISRGDWLADPRALAPTTRIDVRLRLLADSGLRIARMVAAAHASGHDAPRRPRGAAGVRAACRPANRRRVQLVFDTPVCAVPGDRFIVRDAQAAHTDRRRRGARSVRAVAKAAFGTSACAISTRSNG